MQKIKMHAIFDLKEDQLGETMGPRNPRSSKDRALKFLVALLHGLYRQPPKRHASEMRFDSSVGSRLPVLATP
jgi:hypothetical protein